MGASLPPKEANLFKLIVVSLQFYFLSSTSIDELFSLEFYCSHLISLFSFMLILTLGFMTITFTELDVWFECYCNPYLALRIWTKDCDFFKILWRWGHNLYVQSRYLFGWNIIRVYYIIHVKCLYLMSGRLNNVIIIKKCHLFTQASVFFITFELIE